MAYGQDPDPYGAVPPYSIGYQTYTPNYPAIPGVANSFAPGAENAQHPATFHQPVANNNNSSIYPTVAPGATPTGNHLDYSHFYERAGGSSRAPSEATSSVVTAMQAPRAPFNPFAANYQPNIYAGHAFTQPPWGASPSTINPNAGGLGRQAQVPQPIGPRPASNGNVQAPTSAGRLNFGQLQYDGTHSMPREHFDNFVEALPTLRNGAGEQIYADGPEFER